MDEINRGSKKVADDEIDIDQLFNRVGSSLGSMSVGLGRMFRFFRKKVVILTIFSVMGILVAYLVQQNTRPYYSSSMVIGLADIRNDYVYELINNLKLSVKDKNFQALSKHLSISAHSAESIKSIEYNRLDTNPIEEDSIHMSGPVQITVEVFDNQLFDTLQSGIVTYIDNNDFFKKNKDIRKESLESVVAKLKQDIASIDSVKRKAVALNGPANGIVYGEALDPTSLYKESNVFFEKQANLEAELKNLHSVFVTVDFAPRSKPSGPKRSIYLLVGFLLSFTLGVVVALAFDNIRRVA